jgi:hypothetical protein
MGCMQYNTGDKLRSQEIHAELCIGSGPLLGPKGLQQLFFGRPCHPPHGALALALVLPTLDIILEAAQSPTLPAASPCTRAHPRSTVRKVAVLPN